MKKNAIFWIREDFRIEHNPALSFASQNHDNVVALFIYNKDIHWVRHDLTIQPNQSMEVYFRVRYRQPLEKGKIFFLITKS